MTSKKVRKSVQFKESLKGGIPREAQNENRYPQEEPTIQTVLKYGILENSVIFRGNVLPRGGNALHLIDKDCYETILIL